MTFDAVPQMGIPVHCRDFMTVLETIDDFIIEGRATGRSHQIVTVNTDFLVQARRHDDVHAILRSADLALPDGMPIVWASAALGQRLEARIAGADLVPLLSERAAERGHRVMFFGGSGDVAHRAAELLRAANDELVIESATGDVGANGETSPEVLEEIRRFEPDVLCVALGHPKQERWIRRHAASLSIPVAIGVGGTFDFITGDYQRAPVWLQRTGLEWVYRLAQSPRRLGRRYLTDIAVFVPSMLVQVARTRWQFDLLPGRTEKPEATGHKEVVVVSDSPELLVVALDQPGPLDHLTAAALTSMATTARGAGRQIRLIAPGLKATRSLAKLQLDRLIPLIPDHRTLPDELPVHYRDDLGAESDGPSIRGRAAA